MTRGAWRRLRESTEGPTVTVALPREWAEELLQSLMSSLEMDDGMMGDDDMDMDDGGPDELDFGMDGGADPTDLGDNELDLGDGPDLPAGDDSDDEGESPPSKKRGPGRPPGSKSKKKDKPDKKDDPGGDDDGEEKEENVDFSAGPSDGFRAGTAFGESAFRRAGRLLAGGPKRRR